MKEIKKERVKGKEREKGIKTGGALNPNPYPKCFAQKFYFLVFSGQNQFHWAGTLVHSGSANMEKIGHAPCATIGFAPIAI